MGIREIVKALKSGDAERVLAVAEDAAEALLLLEERIAIMGETLTEKEWKDIERQTEDVRQRADNEPDGRRNYTNAGNNRTFRYGSNKGAGNL